MVSGFRDQPRANQNRIGPRSKLHADLRLVRKGLPAGALLLIRNGNAFWRSLRCQVGGRSQKTLDARNSLLDREFMRPLPRNDGDVGQGIDRITLLQKRPQGLLGVAALQKRTMRAFAHAAPQHVLIRFKPNRYSRQGDPGPWLLVHEGAAATGKHTRTVAQQTRHDAALSVAERILSVPRENFCDRQARRGFDLLIGIDEFEAKLLGETPAGRGFARSHESDEDNRAAPECRHERGHAPVTRAVRLCFGSRFYAAAPPANCSMWPSPISTGLLGLRFSGRAPQLALNGAGIPAPSKPLFLRVFQEHEGTAPGRNHGAPGSFAAASVATS